METVEETKAPVVTPEKTEPKIPLIVREAPLAYMGTENKTDVLNKITPDKPEYTIPYYLRMGVQTEKGSAGSLAFHSQPEGKIGIADDTRTEDTKDAVLVTQTEDGRLKISKNGEVIETFTREQLEKQTAVLDLGNGTYLGLTRFNPDTRLIEVYKMKYGKEITVEPTAPLHVQGSDVAPDQSNGHHPDALKPESDIPEPPYGKSDDHENPSSADNGHMHPEALQSTTLHTPEHEGLGPSHPDIDRVTVSPIDGKDTDVDSGLAKPDDKEDLHEHISGTLPPEPDGEPHVDDSLHTEGPKMWDSLKDGSGSSFEGVPPEGDTIHEELKREPLDEGKRELSVETELDGPREKTSRDLALRLSGVDKAKIAGEVVLVALGLTAAGAKYVPHIDIETIAPQCFAEEKLDEPMPSQQEQPVAVAESPYVVQTESTPTFQLSDDNNAVAEKGYMGEERAMIEMFDKYVIKRGDTLNKISLRALSKEFKGRWVPDELRRIVMFATAKANEANNPDYIVKGKEFKVFSQEQIHLLVEYYKQHPEDKMFAKTKKGEYKFADQIKKAEDVNYYFMLSLSDKPTIQNNTITNLP